MTTSHWNLVCPTVAATPPAQTHTERKTIIQGFSLHLFPACTDQENKGQGSFHALLSCPSPWQHPTEQEQQLWSIKCSTKPGPTRLLTGTADSRALPPTASMKMLSSVDRCDRSGSQNMAQSDLVLFYEFFATISLLEFFSGTFSSLKNKGFCSKKRLNHNLGTGAQRPGFTCILGTVTQSTCSLILVGVLTSDLL